MEPYLIVLDLDGTLMLSFDKYDEETFSYLRKLSMKDTNYLLKAAQKINTSFGLNYEIELPCSFCRLDYNSSFRITSEFFGPSIDY